MSEVLTRMEEPVLAAARPGAASHWVHVASHLHPRYGGICAILPEFRRAVADADSCTSMLGFCDPSELSGLTDADRIGSEAIGSSPRSWFLGSRRREILHRLRSADGVHIHGLWEEHGLIAARAARELRKPYVVSAHGMLEPWALKNKRLKKAVYSWLIEHRNVAEAACLHALTQAEAEAYRRFGGKSPIAVIPNGVRIPAVTSSVEFLEAFPHLRDKRLVLFLGRVHYKKGLDVLVNAWKQSKLGEEAHLVIAGPDFENTRSSVERQVNELGLQHQVTFCGMISGSLKWSSLAACEAFVLPSYSEGLSVSVLEAMGMNKPVIVTRQCNIPEAAEADCGWVIEPDAAQLASALTECLSMPSARAAEMGRNGGRLVDSRFNWSVIGAQMRSVYRWLLGGERPSNVALLF